MHKERFCYETIVTEIQTVLYRKARHQKVFTTDTSQEQNQERKTLCHSEGKRYPCEVFGQAFLAQNQLRRLQK